MKIKLGHLYRYLNSNLIVRAQPGPTSTTYRMFTYKKYSKSIMFMICTEDGIWACDRTAACLFSEYYENVDLMLED